ncbi:NEGATIVE REGULATOR OF SYSTEMIC ACQUIRED RESISTANCE SNI1 [Salix purpurea]|uniref:NEGATIVE REGULATOR OF SYSTEMIC ACQUIRED RESISTANCE SNI1 n=3 Tax=Salix TaxID=40685 RepID=A0A9Q1AFW4_SALPP|nr:NEGATIVE REGULATOR OF SYSTEMIC ACQUIRED RESISTANCE SNI1 [Salix purpurea]
MMKSAGIEENLLAILDSASDSKHTPDANDDRLAFLEAVRSACIVNENPPTGKMCEAVFQILRVGKSLELITESFRLLNELDKRFPHVYLSEKEASESSHLIVVEGGWSPFLFNLESASRERGAGCRSISGPLDSLGFLQLMQELGEVANEGNLQALEIKSLRNMLVFQYLINALEGDFLPRNRVYEETMNWTHLRESLLNLLLSTRKINYKGLMKDCLTIMCGLFDVSAGISEDLESPDNAAAKLSHNDNTASALALFELGSNACFALQKLLIMIMDLDMSRKKADMQGSTTRADGVRTPLMEIILDEITYDTDMLSPFLKVFNEPKWKLEIILQYFSKYTTRLSTRTRRSNGPTEDATTFSGVLNCFSNVTSTRSITKKISADVVQVLLAHAFQAHLSLSCQQDADGIAASKDEGRSSSLAEICENIISAFSNLRRTDAKMEILPIGKEALFTAATILSTETGAQV